MGEPTPAKKKRNEQLIKDYRQEGLSVVRLVSKYKISSTRIYQILRANGIEPNRRNY